MSQTRFINPDALSKPPGYTHVVEASAPARIVYVAGQLGVDRDGKVVGDFRRQAVQTFENLKSALAAVGAEFRHVVKFNNYLVDVAHLPIFREVRDSYLPEKDRPASTTIAISGLARAGGVARDRGGRGASGGRIQGCIQGQLQARRCRPQASRSYQSLAIATKVRSAKTGSSTSADHSM